MTSHSTGLRARAGGALLATVVASGVAATAALGAAGPAYATCASFFGLGNTGECSSGVGSIAIAIGSNAIAHADGLFGVALSIGDQSRSTTAASSVFTVASALGTRAGAQVAGILQAAISAGSRGRSMAGIGPTTLQFGSVALNLGNHSNELANEVSVRGFGNLGVNVGGNAVLIDVTGSLNNATNLFGSTNIYLTAGGALSWAFNVLGKGNTVEAGPGSLAIAGSVGQSGATVKQAPFGININGAAIPPSAVAIQAAKHNSRKLTHTAQTGASHASSSGRAHSGRG